MPSILNTKALRVLRCLNKHGFYDIKLTIYILKDTYKLEEVVVLEQHILDCFKPKIYVDLVATSSGYHVPMSQEIRYKLRKERGTPVYMYNVKDITLIHVFDSKLQLYSLINIHHKTLNYCLNLGYIYLDTFFFFL